MGEEKEMEVVVKKRPGWGMKERRRRRRRRRGSEGK